MDGQKCSTCSTGYKEFPACDKCAAEYYGLCAVDDGKCTCIGNNINSIVCNLKTHYK